MILFKPSTSRTAFLFGEKAGRMIGKFSCLLMMTMPLVAFAQVLFPGNSPERRSRTYDVTHYKLVVGFNEPEKKVDGTTSITFTPISATLDSIVLDAEEMNIKSVSTPRGVPLRFNNRSPQLTAFFVPPLHLNDTVTISIEYSCIPKAGLYFIQPDSTSPSRRHQIWSQGEDTDNHYWFPCYDYPNDKATSEVIATVPESYELLSNGKLVKTFHDPQRKTRTFHWVESKPHPSYLIMIAAGEYTVVREQDRGIAFEYYVYRDRVQDGVRSLAKTRAVMKFFEEQIGVSYPWEKYSQIWISNFMWGGMENTSAVTLNDDAYMLDPRAAVDFVSEDVVAHELAHQWWGDLVTSRDWSNLWLHEGFANYFEALFKQDQKGDDYFQYDLMQQANSVLSTEEGQGRSPLVGKDGYTVNVYSKGCWVLHMLRNILGEEEFWKAIRYYARRYSFKNVDSHEFMLAIEDATGENLGWFFEQWVYKAGHPRVSVDSHWDDDTRLLTLELTQTQVMDSLTGVFKFPLTIECRTPTLTKTMSVLIEKQQQEVAISLPEKPLLVILDKGKHVLATFDSKKTTEEYVYQLNHATDVADRIAAAKKLNSFNSDENVFEALRIAALHDPFWAVRDEALTSLTSSDDSLVKRTLFDAYGDRHSTVRASAINGLSRFSSGDVSEFVMRASTDSSLLVLSACLRVLSEIDTARGFELAARWVGVDSYRNIIRRAALNAMLHIKDDRAVPFALTYSDIANPGDIRRQSVRLLGEVGKHNAEARMRLMTLLNDGVSTVRKTAIDGIALWKDEQAKEVLVQRQAIEADETVKTALVRAIKSLSEDSDSDSQH